VKTWRYNPGTLQHHKWENAMTLDSRSWGNRRDMNIGREETIVIYTLYPVQ
jgi:alpha-L-fucosidase